MKDNFGFYLYIKVIVIMYKVLSDYVKERGRSVSEVVCGLIVEEVCGLKVKDVVIVCELIVRIDKYGKWLKVLGVEKE